MGAFTVWFNATSPKGKTPLLALTRAGIAHLYFESIHPSEDCNGRIGRTLCEKVLSRTLLRVGLHDRATSGRSVRLQLAGRTATACNGMG